MWWTCPSRRIHKLTVDWPPEAWEGHKCCGALLPWGGMSQQGTRVLVVLAPAGFGGWQLTLNSRSLAAENRCDTKRWTAFCWVFELNWLHRVLHREKWEQGGAQDPATRQEGGGEGWDIPAAPVPPVPPCPACAWRAGRHGEGTSLIKPCVSLQDNEQVFRQCPSTIGLDLMPSVLRMMCL